jgi:NADH-quinone oxidoreductase subunit M
VGSDAVTLTEIPALLQIGFPVLSVLIFLPLGAALLLRFIRDSETAYTVALGVSIAELVLALLVWLRFTPNVSDMQFVEHLPLIPALGFSYHLGVDGISMLFLPATALLGMLAVMYAETNSREDTSGYLSAMLMFEGIMIGAFVALDLLMFWFWFVAELYPSWLLITRWGTGEKRFEAARAYVTMMLAGSGAMLIGMIMLAISYASVTGGGVTFDYVKLLGAEIPGPAQATMFFLICIGLAVKAPIFPLHTWMPKVLEQGPIVGMSVFLVGIKLGTYGLLRFAIPLFPQAAAEWFWLLAMLGVIGMVYGALIALIQTNLRRLLAFASLSHVGVVMLGLFSLNFEGFQGGLMQMLNLGITGAGLFFLAGFLFRRVGQPDLRSMGGVQEFAPYLAMAFLVIGLAGIGMPGTSGFNGEHLIMLGAYKVSPWMAGAAGLGTMLSASYFLRYYQQAFLGRARDAKGPVAGDLGKRELGIAGALIAFVIVIGLYPTPFLNTMNGSLRAIEAHVGKAATHAESKPVTAPESAVVHAAAEEQ